MTGLLSLEDTLGSCVCKLGFTNALVRNWEFLDVADGRY